VDCGARVSKGRIYVRYKSGNKYHAKTNKPKELKELTMSIKQEITSFKLSAIWSDGKTEGLASHLPEYLYDQLQDYFRELEDLREEHDNDLRDEEYSFGEDESKEIK
jgi:hypothetical protein